MSKPPAASIAFSPPSPPSPFSWWCWLFFSPFPYASCLDPSFGWFPFPATYPVDAHSTSHSSTPTTPTPISALVSGSSPAFIAFLLCPSFSSSALERRDTDRTFFFSRPFLRVLPNRWPSLAINSQRPHFGSGKSFCPPIRYLDSAVLEERATRAEEARQMAERRIFELESQVRHSSH